MTKQELQALLARSGSTLYRLCIDLGLAHSTASRWRGQVPRYAEWYARSLVRMSPIDAAEARAEMGGGPGAASKSK